MPGEDSVVMAKMNKEMRERFSSEREAVGKRFLGGNKSVHFIICLSQEVLLINV